MATDIRKYYRTTDKYERYHPEGERRKEIEELYNTFKKYFGKKILDICCGGGILGFIVEKDGKGYVGVDINPDMISLAKEYAKKTRAKKCRFYLVDAKNFLLNEKFDTITCLGNALCHINVFDWIKIMENINKMSKKRAYLIVEYRDVVKLLYEKKWKDVMVYEENGKKLVDLLAGADLRKGDFLKFAFSPENNETIEFTHAIWSPFIMRAIMQVLGWEIIEERENPKWQGITEVYKKKNRSLE